MLQHDVQIIKMDKSQCEKTYEFMIGECLKNHRNNPNNSVKCTSHAIDQYKRCMNQSKSWFNINKWNIDPFNGESMK